MNRLAILQGRPSRELINSTAVHHYMPFCKPSEIFQALSQLLVGALLVLVILWE